MSAKYQALKRPSSHFYPDLENPGASEAEHQRRRIVVSGQFRLKNGGQEVMPMAKPPGLTSERNG
jgi:hypothetical protein